MINPAGKLRAIPPSGWVSLAAIAGVVFLAWHHFANDDMDTDWTTPKETQAPEVSPFPSSPGVHGSGAPMSHSAPFRSRAYPPSLTESPTSLIGEF